MNISPRVTMMFLFILPFNLSPKLFRVLSVIDFPDIHIVHIINKFQCWSKLMCMQLFIFTEAHGLEAAPSPTYIPDASSYSSSCGHCRNDQCHLDLLKTV